MALELNPYALLALAAAVSACGSASARGAGPDASVGDGAHETSMQPMPMRDTGTSPSDAPIAGDAPSPPPPDAAGTDADASTDSGALQGPLVAYASGYGPNIDVFAVDPTSGALTLASSIPAFGTSPSFLAVNRESTHLYAVDENAMGRVGAYSVGAAGALTFQNAVSSGGNGPPFVALDRSEAYVLVANYGDGTVSVLPLQPGGAVGSATTTLTVGTNAHMIATDLTNRFAFVPCLGSDYVAQFLFDAATGALSPNVVARVSTAAGAGPRHIAFHPNGQFVYLINEKNSTLSAYSLDPAAGTLTEVQTVSTLPPGFTGTNTAAEVWVHPSGSWVLGSNRGDDSIVVFIADPATGHLSGPTFTKTGGTTPRDFTIDPTGTFVYAANQGSGNVVPFRFDATAGTLTATGAAVTVAAASFVGVVRLPP